MAEWDADVARASALAQDVSYALAERDGLRRTGGNISDVSARIRNQLAQLDRSVEALDKAVKEAETMPSKFRL
jgi:hypothetical protein